MINTNNCTSSPKLEDFLVPPKWIPFETKAAYRLHEARWMVESSQKNVSGVSDIYRSGVTIRGLDAIIVRHCHEFEGQWLKLLEDLHHMPVLPTGLMPPLVESSSDEKNESWILIKEWLDEKPKGLVVYVALGSEVTISQSEINELACGLELSGSPFFWVLRKSSRLGNIDPIVLPDGFEERTKGQGIVWKSWAPQMKILSHKSVGGFLTHCGWNSVIEALCFGRVLIMFPVLNDQGLNTRLLQEKGVGVEIPRNEKDGFFTSDSVAEAVKFGVVSEEGELLRANARQMSGLFGDRKRNEELIDDCVGYLMENRIRKS